MIDRLGLGLRDYKYTFILFSTLATLAILFSVAATGIRPAYAGVADTTPPLITCPANVQEQATSPGDISISGYPPVTLADFEGLGGSASDNVDTSLDYLYSGPSSFPVGNTPVTHTVTDDFGNSASCGQLITVLGDTTPPQITCPPNNSTETSSPSGVSLPDFPATLAEFLASGGSASDDVDTSLDYSNNAPSVFPIGDTSVMHTVTDDFGNSASCTQLVTVELVPLPVEIDIKPGNNPNSINLKKDKIITVAVLGSSTFDVNTIDRSPLSDAPKFGGATPQAPIRFSLQDVNKDGYIDLVLQYKLLGLGFDLSSTEGCITGMLTDGTLFEGCDSVRIVPPS